MSHSVTVLLECSPSFCAPWLTVHAVEGNGCTLPRVGNKARANGLRASALRVRSSPQLASRPRPAGHVRLNVRVS